ncbi:hypothetical protein [Nodularia spumigena]|uniref:hypothetical protein n=1 Tax=Nodularia spumigena TaxID=70799 RepID=UPI00232AD2DA|nr:hypothetical protein [Nodularia spumigena]MDB9356894.1 hypothetical protein [Nodularia spumigena CS-587/03]MDB9319715.1 hypothetical protein [Nodularia spumigena CS-590/01A]MDB9328459.1 hypothetical protein [Nodularia spumigena CS-590/02]MDB9334264.1 hypothetical protein [Nodularia spumigena CS-590/01]MDB9340137.1 hypothetical protein [Nodularia spumigena CS-589/07]
MLIPSRYWTITVIDSPVIQRNQLTGGYKLKQVHQAQEYFRIHFPELTSKPTLSAEENKHIQAVLWEIFDAAADIRERAIAGLCLRCYISKTILVLCKKIAHTYQIFSYIDLLPFVLNDDGKTLVIFNPQEKTQQILNNDGTNQLLAKEAEFFTVEILRKFNPKLNSSESLDNWTWRLTQQNQYLRLFLWEFGIKTPSDWGLLCRENSRSIKPLLPKDDYEIVQVFHAVYRRDRRKFNEKGSCADPKINQLQEMLVLLQQRHIIVSSSKELLHHLHRIAEILRQDTLYQQTGRLKTIPTEVYDQSIQDYVPNQELPYHTDPALEDIELQQLQSVCNKLFENILYQAIAEVISQHIAYLKKSKGYKEFAEKLYAGLLLYYQENMTLGEVAQIWEIPWYRVRRIFKLESLLDNVQYRTEERFIEELLNVATTPDLPTSLTTICTNPDYLNNIAEEIRSYALTKTFLKARAEIQTGKKKVKNSLFAQILCGYINDSLNNSV